MIPKIFKLNKFVQTRIPRPYELFRLTGFKAVNNGAMYSEDNGAMTQRKLDAIADEFSRIPEPGTQADDLPE